jgi:hypothetical protein
MYESIVRLIHDSTICGVICVANSLCDVLSAPYLHVVLASKTDLSCAILLVPGYCSFPGIASTFLYLCSVR